jgi:hypothetical protein
VIHAKRNMGGIYGLFAWMKNSFVVEHRSKVHEEQKDTKKN